MEDDITTVSTFLAIGLSIEHAGNDLLLVVLCLPLAGQSVIDNEPSDGHAYVNSRSERTAGAIQCYCHLAEIQSAQW